MLKRKNYITIVLTTKHQNHTPIIEQEAVRTKTTKYTINITSESFGTLNSKYSFLPRDDDSISMSKS